MLVSAKSTAPAPGGQVRGDQERPGPGRGADPVADTVAIRRWPRPTAGNVILAAVWVAGIAFATLVPWTIVSPMDTSPEPGRVWLACAASALGIAVFAAAGIAVYRRTGNGSLLAWALIPGVSIGTGAVIFTATLLSL